MFGGSQRVSRRRWRATAISTATMIGLWLASNSGAAQDVTPFDPASFSVGLELVAEGLEQPVHVADAGDESGRLFVVEQPGRIRIVVDGEIEAEPFLDITEIVEAGGSEQGLLSVAFHPDYVENGEFFVGYTAKEGEGAGNNTIARYRVSGDDPNLADASSGEVLISVEDPFPNHNGGLVLFGPDGYLYAGLGDGGSGGDPEENGQNPLTLLGSILRIDVDSETDELPYAIPDDNPFADGEAGRPEVWAYGLRNPWRFSFDRETGDLHVADVGQNQIEEVNMVAADELGGQNYGWNPTEGTQCFLEEDCDTSGFTLPVAEYSHEFGCSVTGGYVYRGESEAELQGVYLFADYCSGLVWGMGRDANGEFVTSEPLETDLNISSFGEDARGEVYVTANGGLYQVIAGS